MYGCPGTVRKSWPTTAETVHQARLTFSSMPRRCISILRRSSGPIGSHMTWDFGGFGKLTDGELIAAPRPKSDFVDVDYKVLRDPPGPPNQ
jgi:hypothetical protein